jgi:hypothetical protein
VESESQSSDGSERELPNCDIEADVALALLGTTQLNARSLCRLVVAAQFGIGKPPICTCSRALMVHIFIGWALDF